MSESYYLVQLTQWACVRTPATCHFVIYFRCDTLLVTIFLYSVAAPLLSGQHLHGRRLTSADEG